MKFKAQKLPAQIDKLQSDCLILPVYKSERLPKSLRNIDKALGGAINTLYKNGDFNGSSQQLVWIPVITGAKIQRVLLSGCGDKPKNALPLALQLQHCLAALSRAASSKKIVKVHLVPDNLCSDANSVATVARQLAQEFEHASYRYTTTKSINAPKPTLHTVTLLSDAGKPAALNKALAQGQAIGQGMNASRELGNLPGNICTPGYLAKNASAMARNNTQLRTRILNEKQMQELGMGSLLSVSAGSREPAKLIAMEYRNGGKNKANIVLVGKGITFDTGGVSLKPGAAMDEMKFDMCGAATVFGVMTAVTQLELPINLIGLVAAAENMPDGLATKPGDVVTSMSGQTIEVLNTDAEGRLVLCDALTYAERYKPAAVIDIATLTGACIIALGKQASGLFSNNDELAARLLAAGESTGDRAWRLPIWDEYDKQLKSNFADIANVGGREAGSITAACFLKKFTGKYPWAHVDIAGTAWHSGGQKGATGRPVPLLMEYLLGQI